MSSIGRPVAIGLAGLVVLVALVLGIRMGGGETETPATSGTAAADDALIALKISARPATATIFVDGVRVGDNPFSAKFPSDGTAHRIRVEAEGYDTHEEMVTFDADIGRTIVLSEPLGDTSPSATASAVSDSSLGGAAGVETGAGTGTATAVPPPVWVRPVPYPTRTGASTATPTGLEVDPWGNKK